MKNPPSLSEQCNSYTRTGRRCLLHHGHDGNHQYEPVKVELPKPRVQGFDRMFATLERAVIYDRLSAILFQMQNGEASDFIDADTEEFAEGTVGAEENAARRDLQWCRKQLAEVVKSLA